MKGKFLSKILVFVTAITHNCDSFSCWSQIFHILPSICEGFILPLQIRFFERAFWVCQKFLVTNRHFSCSDSTRSLQQSMFISIRFGNASETWIVQFPKAWAILHMNKDIFFKLFNKGKGLKPCKGKGLKPSPIWLSLNWVETWVVENFLIQ